MTRVQKARARGVPRPAPAPEAPGKRISKMKVFIGLAVLIGAFTAFVAPGFAEFESGGTENKGKGEVFKATLTEGPTTISCEAAEENASKVGWSIENGGKEFKKGAGLRMKFENWGSCTYVAAAGQEGKAELKGCELEVEEKEKETKEPISLIACTAVLSGECEIKLPEQKRENIEIRGAGEADENTAFSLNASSSKAEVNKACASFGVQTSEAVDLLAEGELYSVKTAAPNLKFSPEKAGEENKFDENTNNGVGGQLFVFEKAGKKLVMKCSTSKFEGKIVQNSTRIAVVPAYSGCGEGNTVTVTKCQYFYLLHTEEPLTEYDGYLAIGNNGGTCEILFKGEGCEIAVPAQRKRLVMTYENILGKPQELKAKTNFLFPMEYEVKKACNGLTTGLSKTANYVGQAKLMHVNIIE